MFYTSTCVKSIFLVFFCSSSCCKHISFRNFCTLVPLLPTYYFFVCTSLLLIRLSATCAPLLCLLSPPPYPFIPTCNLIVTVGLCASSLLTRTASYDNYRPTTAWCSKGWSGRGCTYMHGSTSVLQCLSAASLTKTLHRSSFSDHFIALIGCFDLRKLISINFVRLWFMTLSKWNDFIYQVSLTTIYDLSLA